MRFDRSEELRSKAHALIPGGAHTYAKGDDQYPSRSPGFIARGSGCHVWDVDGNEFIEYGMGMRAVTLGHAYGPVVDAAGAQMHLGTNFTRPSPIEVDYAEAMLQLVDGADQIKFAKDGSTVTTAAVRLARAHTGRDIVARCADHPFFSYNDWFIGSTEMDAGIPNAVKALTTTFRYKDPASVQAVFERHPEQIACLILEPARTEEPRDGFLEATQQLCRKHGAVLIFDEIITGFRWHLGGAQAEYGVVPDLSAFGKAMGNGFAVSALLGKRDLMERGGIDHGAARVFLLSTTHGAENHALAAGLAVLETYQREDVIGHIYRQGARLRTGIDEIASDLGIENHFGVLGRDCNLVYFTRDAEHRPSQPFRTLFLQELIRGGVLAPSFVVSYAHIDADIDSTLETVRRALDVYRRALADGVDSYLVGPSVRPVDRKYA